MIFNLFKSGTEERPDDVKSIRHALLQFIKQELQKAEGGEGSNIKGLCVYLNCDPKERHTYEAAVYVDEPNKLKAEIQRICDDYALNLPFNWTLSIIFDEDIPDEAVVMSNLSIAFFIKTNKHFVKLTATAYLQALSGETLKPSYTLSSEGGKYNIGRDAKAQSDEGYFRTNHSAFPSTSKNESNKYISRQHAHIEWNHSTAKFMIFADEGGIPPRNKIKLRSALTEKITKLHSAQIGHELEEGDQIILGESVVLAFSYQEFENE